MLAWEVASNATAMPYHELSTQQEVIAAIYREQCLSIHPGWPEGLQLILRLCWSPATHRPTITTIVHHTYTLRKWTREQELELRGLAADVLGTTARGWRHEHHHQQQQQADQRHQEPGDVGQTTASAAQGESAGGNGVENRMQCAAGGGAELAYVSSDDEDEHEQRSAVDARRVTMNPALAVASLANLNQVVSQHEQQQQQQQQHRHGKHGQHGLAACKSGASAGYTRLSVSSDKQRQTLLEQFSDRNRMYKRPEYHSLHARAGMPKPPSPRKHTLPFVCEGAEDEDVSVLVENATTASGSSSSSSTVAAPNKHQQKHQHNEHQGDKTTRLPSVAEVPEGDAGNDEDEGGDGGGDDELEDSVYGGAGQVFDDTRGDAHNSACEGERAWEQSSDDLSRAIAAAVQQFTTPTSTGAVRDGEGEGEDDDDEADHEDQSSGNVFFPTAQGSRHQQFSNGTALSPDQQSTPSSSFRLGASTPPPAYIDHDEFQSPHHQGQDQQQLRLRNAGGLWEATGSSVPVRGGIRVQTSPYCGVRVNPPSFSGSGRAHVVAAGPRVNTAALGGASDQRAAAAAAALLPPRPWTAQARVPIAASMRASPPLHHPRVEGAANSRGGDVPLLNPAFQQLGEARRDGASSAQGGLTSTSVV